MGCTCAPTPTSPSGADSYLSCVHQGAIFDEAHVMMYADRYGCTGGKNNWLRCFAISALRANRLIYYRQQPGDCGAATGGPNAKGAQLTQAGLKVGVGLVPVIGNVLQQIVNFLPFAHHAQAVATEQATLCDVTVNWNAFQDQMEYALANKAIGLQDAIIKIQQVHDLIQQEATTVSNPTQKNAGYGFVKTLDALLAFDKEVVYPGLVPGNISNLVSKLTEKTGAVGTAAIATGAGVVIAKIAGIF